MGDAYEVRADVASIQSLSAHGDYNDLIQFMMCQDSELVKKVFLVHGDYKVQEPFSQRLSNRGFKTVAIPSLHEMFELSESVETINT
jgi:metallo-beta-lactamase family protein